ncbi:MAG: hypothetical protein ACRDPC_20965 [Solirubrobacteraceae bacterium]
MVPMIRASRAREFDDDEPAILSCFVVEDEPSPNIPDSELAWWLQCQEQAETRAALAAAGLL